MEDNFDYITSNIKISFSEFDDFIKAVELDFIPPLYGRINVGSYFCKLKEKAILIHCWNQNQLIALMALYCNDQINKKSYIPLIAVKREFRGKNIATNMLKIALKIAKDSGMQYIGIHTNNKIAYQCYLKSGFDLIDVHLIENGIKRYYLEKKL